MGQFKLVLLVVADMCEFAFVFFLVVVISSDSFQLPLPWISTFFEIQNFLILCTHFSEEFCLSLCSAGFVYFMECEMEKFMSMTTSIVSPLENSAV